MSQEFGLLIPFFPNEAGGAAASPRHGPDSREAGGSRVLQ